MLIKIGLFCLILAAFCNAEECVFDGLKLKTKTLEGEITGAYTLFDFHDFNSDVVEMTLGPYYQTTATSSNFISIGLSGVGCYAGAPAATNYAGFTWDSSADMGGKPLQAYLFVSKAGGYCLLDFRMNQASISYRANAGEGMANDGHVFWLDPNQNPITCSTITNKPGTNTYRTEYVSIYGGKPIRYMNITGGIWALDEIRAIMDGGTTNEPQAAPVAPTPTAPTAPTAPIDPPKSAATMSSVGIISLIGLAYLLA